MSTDMGKVTEVLNGAQAALRSCGVEAVPYSTKLGGWALLLNLAEAKKLRDWIRKMRDLEAHLERLEEGAEEML